MEDRPVTGQSEPRAGAFKEGKPELGDRVTLKEREDELHDGRNAEQETKDVESRRTPFRGTALNPQKQCDDAPLCEHSGWESQEKGNPGPVKSVEYLQKETALMVPETKATDIQIKSHLHFEPTLDAVRPRKITRKAASITQMTTKHIRTGPMPP
ncbi:Hypothetical protein D9617_52g060330 [Elsinoe fawcettii]|nr:Hypothetical protein D9617_52g060330 [Elsinoe fawcettii]